VVVLADTHAPRRWKTCPPAVAETGQRIFNPGSPTDRRRQPRGTLGLLDVADGRLIQARIVPVT